MNIYSYKEKFIFKDKEGNNLLPFDDEMLKYNEFERIYILDEDFANKQLGVNLKKELGSALQVSGMLDFIGRSLFNYILAGVLNNTYDQQTKQYIYACDHDLRKPIARAMVSMLRAELQSDWYSAKNEWDRTEFDVKGHPHDVKAILSQTSLLTTGTNYRVDPDVVDVGY